MNDQPRLLIVEDSEADALLLQLELRKEGIDARVQRVETEADLGAALADREWDIVLSDYNLTGFNGMAALQVVRVRDPDLPFIMISGVRGEEFAVEAMRAGASDFITKDKLVRLASSIRRELEAKEERQARQAADVAFEIRNRRLRLLSELAEALLAAGAPVDAATAAFRMIADELQLHAYFNFFITSDNSLQLDSCAGIPDHAAHLIGRLQLGEAVCGQVAMSGEARHVTDIQNSDDERLRLLRRFGIRAYFCSPLRSGEHVRGTLSFGTHSRDRFSDDELDFMRTVVRYVALADERLRAEEALRRSGAQFQAFFENAAVGTSVLDLESRILRVNDFFCATMGYSREELLGKNLHELTHPDYLEAELAGFRALLREERPTFVIEKLYVRKDGSPICVEETTGIIVASEGRPERLACIVQNISERKRSEAERERLLAELDATIESLPSAVIIYNAEGKIRRMNPYAEKMFRYSPELQEQPFMERKASLRPETPDGHPYPLGGHPTMRALRGGTALAELMVYHPAGRNEPLWVAVSAAPIRGADGRILGAVSTTIDVTSLHQLQREREIYVHTISHDLRTPLTVVLGHAEMLETTCQDEDSVVHIDAIRRGAERMENMIEDLVESARLEGGDITLEKEPVRLDEFLPDLLRQASPALEVERITIDVPAETPLVSVDPLRLERIITNLLTNALKYSPPESPITVAARAGGEEVVVSVQDLGQGIHPEDQQRIFERFYRSREGRKADSVGLGLYITRSLVEAHGGRIWVESAPGAGSTFFFALPVATGKTASGITPR